MTSLHLHPRHHPWPCPPSTAQPHLQVSLPTHSFPPHSQPQPPISTTTQTTLPNPSSSPPLPLPHPPPRPSNQPTKPSSQHSSHTSKKLIPNPSTLPNQPSPTSPQRQASSRGPTTSSLPSPPSKPSERHASRLCTTSSRGCGGDWGWKKRIWTRSWRIIGGARRGSYGSMRRSRS